MGYASVHVRKYIHVCALGGGEGGKISQKNVKHKQNKLSYCGGKIQVFLNPHKQFLIFNLSFAGAHLVVVIQKRADAPTDRAERQLPLQP